MALHLSDNSDDHEAVHEINVTPFIDVILVLLIIFMVAAPLSTVSIPVDLPAVTAQPQPRPDAPVYLTIKADRAVFIDKHAVALDQLKAGLDERTQGDTSSIIFLRADTTVDYGDLMVVIDGLRAAGYLRVGLVGLETVSRQ